MGPAAYEPVRQQSPSRRPRSATRPGWRRLTVPPGHRGLGPARGGHGRANRPSPGQHAAPLGLREHA
eukprot:9200896-Lingulodinium_polyedra.AAC.1